MSDARRGSERSVDVAARVLAASTAALIAATAAVVTSAAHANPFDAAPSAVEFARLPEYCPDSQGYRELLRRPPEVRARWLAIMGPTFNHIHHYCIGLLKAMRAESATSRQLRQSLLGSAIQECDYVVQRAPADFPLLPEILLRMGQYSAALERYHDSLTFFERSRTLKRDYWPAYLEAAKIETTLRRQDRAKLLIEEGLREVPDQPALLNARGGIAKP